MAFQIHLIKQDFSCIFRFDFWQFWCPLKKKFMQYLIWKLSLVVRNLRVGKGVAALLHSTIQSWRVPILLHTESKERFWGSTAVSNISNIKIVFLVFNNCLKEQYFILVYFFTTFFWIFSVYILFHKSSFKCNIQLKVSLSVEFIQFKKLRKCQREI